MVKSEVVKKKPEVTKPMVKTLRRYVANRNIEARLKDGWKIIDSDLKDMGLADAAVKVAQGNKDLVLMEKIV